MPLNKFEVHQPESMEQALDLLSLHRTSVKVLAGGTDLIPGLKAGNIKFSHLVSINRVAGLKSISFTHEDGLVIGAGARISEVGEHPEVQEFYPALAHACQVMATPQIRNMGTVVGNLANSSPSADTAAPLLAHRASLVLVERGGRRQVQLNEFFTGPRANVMEPIEMIEAIRVPAPPQRTGADYQRLSARSKVDIAAVGVAGCLTISLEHKIIGARLALNSVAPTPVRCPEAEEMLLKQEPDGNLFMRAAVACVRACRPIDDMRATANYRRRIVQVLAQRVLEKCAERAGQGGDK